VMASTQRLGRIVAALLVLGAALFVLAVGLEPGDHHDAPAATATAGSGEQGGHDEAAEAAQGRSDNST
jgi:hypothetical protein